MVGSVSNHTAASLSPRNLFESEFRHVVSSEEDSQSVKDLTSEMSEHIEWRYVWTDWHYLWMTDFKSEDHLAQGWVYNVQLRKADADDAWGILVSVSEEDECLLVEDILPGGVVASFNALCAKNPNEGRAKKIIRVGDKILSVNDIWNKAQKMMEEFSEILCKMTIVRGATCQSLRADANVFVPSVGSHDLLVPLAADFLRAIPDLKDIHFL